MPTTQAIILSSPRTVEIVPLSIPEPESNEVVVLTELCGLCTPEQRAFRGIAKAYPYWGGHELCGIVEHVSGDSTQQLALGTRVVVALQQRCGECSVCRRGLDNFCAYLNPRPSQFPTLAGPGGLSTRIVVPSYKVFPVGSSLPASLAALTEPLACVLRSIRRARACPGERALVLGAGTMGLLHTILLRALQCDVFVVDEEPHALAQASEAGAMVAPLDDYLARSEVFEPELVFSTRLGPEAIERVIEGTAPGTRIVLYQSTTEERFLRVASNILRSRELELIGTLAQRSRDLSEAVRLLPSLSSALSNIRVEEFEMQKASAAFARSLDPDVNRVMIRFVP